MERVRWTVDHHEDERYTDLDPLHVTSGIISALQPWSDKAEWSAQQRWPRWLQWGRYWKLTFGNADVLIGSQGDAKRKRGGKKDLCRSRTWWTSLTGEYSKATASHRWLRSWEWMEKNSGSWQKKFKNPLGVSSRRTRRMEAEENQKRLLPGGRGLSTNVWIQRGIVPKVDRWLPESRKITIKGLNRGDLRCFYPSRHLHNPFPSRMFIHMLFIFSAHWPILVSPTFRGHPLVPQCPLSPPNVLVL